MFGVDLLRRIFGSRNQRTVKKLMKTVARINAYEPALVALSDVELKHKTQGFKSRLKAGATLEDLLPEAFAVVREASRRTLGLRHFDVQLIGGMVLHQGKIAEMHTGEGKTLMAVLPAYLNALTGQPVHIVTVNDYLVRRDADWMRPIYTLLDLTVGTVVAEMPLERKQAAYRADVVYGTNNEFGFDYLRDNMAYQPEYQVQSALSFAIVDEVDSILVDEARTPLIISGPTEGSSDLYRSVNVIVPKLERQLEENGPGDFSVDEKHRQVYLTESGHDKAEALLVEQGLLMPGESVYSAQHIALVHHLNAALRAHALFQRDVDYIVTSGEVVIVDEHTGRTMPGRRWSDGLHQAVEAKEGVKIQQENQTLASITFQNYFRLYSKLAGMTGTADTEAYEFQQIYHLEVVVIPTNQAVKRKDQSDQVFLTTTEKFDAVVSDVIARHQKQQPVLLGTASIETSEVLSKRLTDANIPHQVLNAKYHEKEAAIIAEAGRPGAVTIATNMAGRGTDIVLGGHLAAEIAALVEPSGESIAQLHEDWQRRHQFVIDAGGLYVLGSERHESRRIDNQLRGRSGRQGDPGETRFYLSLDDNLMRIFASPRLKGMMAKLGMAGQVIESGLITRSIEGAQRRVEGLHFEIRKQLLEYDNVANEQRKVIYEQRRALMRGEAVEGHVLVLFKEVLTRLVEAHIPADMLEESWDVTGLTQRLQDEFMVEASIQSWLDEDDHCGAPEILARIVALGEARYLARRMEVGNEVWAQLERHVLLQVLDHQWKEHLVAMDYLRQAVGLRGYAQKDPKQEYKREAFGLFVTLIESYQYEVCSILMRYQLVSGKALEALETMERARAEAQINQDQSARYQHQDPAVSDAMASPGGLSDPSLGAVQSLPQKKLGRNDPCFCGSGEKYKYCHGQLA